MNALAKAHAQMLEDGAPPELLRHPPQVANGNQVAIADPQPAEATAIAKIIEMARDTSLPLDRLEKVLQMQQQMEARKDERAFNEAMARAQAEMRTVALDSSNPQTRSRYASYAALDRDIRPHYTRHGFALSFNTGDGAPENCIRILCDVSCGGHSRRYHIDMPADGKGAKGGDVMTKTHATGSAISYGQRYLLKMIFNVSTGEADDDGNSAGGAVITGSLKQNYLAECREHIRKATDGKALAEWWKSDASAKARKDFELTSDEVKPLRDFVVARCTELLGVPA